MMCAEKSVNQSKSRSRIAGMLPLIIGAAMLSYGEVVYENDFATRTSKGVVPYSDWREQPYVTGSLVYRDL